MSKCLFFKNNKCAMQWDIIDFKECGTACSHYIKEKDQLYFKELNNAKEEIIQTQ